jgi:transporter family protein
MAVDRIHPYQIQLVSTVVYVLLIPVWFQLCQKQNLSSYDNMGIIYAAICITTSIIGAVCMGFTLNQSNNPGVISALVSLSPVITMALSIMFLHETLSPIKIVAFSLALLSAILVNF